MPNRAFETDEIIRAVRERKCRRPPHRELADKDYYADENGNVYSLNGAAPKRIEAKTGWGGFQWVVLATADGWHRYHVGELIAATFLENEKPGDGDYTVNYKNGESGDNRVENLEWISKIEASAIRQTTMVKPERSKSTEALNDLIGLGAHHGVEKEGATGQSKGSVSKEDEIRTLLERNRLTQNRLEALQTDYTMVLDALRVFAEHTLSADLRLGHPDTAVVESNKGKANHGVITVADFRRAKETLEAIEQRSRTKPQI